MEEFKVGDTVRQITACSGAERGKTYELIMQAGSLTTNVGRAGTGCSCPTNWELIQKGGKMVRKIWNVIVVDKTEDKIIVNEVVLDGDEKSACAKVSISFAAKLKDLIFDNLAYVTKELGSYEKKESKD